METSRLSEMNHWGESSRDQSASTDQLELGEGFVDSNVR